MSEEKAPFNSALDLLERLSDILRHITKVKQNIFLDRHQKQEYTLELLKDYYIQAIPLLSTEARNNLKGILELQQKEVKITKYNKTTGEIKKRYSLEVENKINLYLIKLQIDLQDVGGYFMPPRRKLGKVVGDF